MASSLTQRPNPVRFRENRPVSLEEKIAEMLTFAIPASSFYTVHLGGQLPIGEIIMLAMLPAALILRHERIFQSRYKWAYILMAVWLFSEILSDVHAGTSPVDRAKGMARILFFGIDLATISVLVGSNLRRIKIFALGLVIMYLVDAKGASGYFGAGPEWKMYLFFACGIALFLLSSPSFARGRYLLVWISIAFLAVTSVYLGARSATLFSLVAAAPMATRTLSRFGIVGKSPRQRAFKFILLAILAIGAAWAAQKAVRVAMRSGIYDAAQDAKFQQQDAGKLGVLFGGRPEGLVAIRAIRDSPIIGYGSYASNPKYTVMLQDFRYKYGYADTDAISEENSEGEPLIPAHSHITMAWIDGGVLASFIWFYLLWVCGRSIVRLTDVFHPLAPLYCFLFISMFWDILFSPFGETRRMQEAFYIVLMFNLPSAARRLGTQAGISPLFHAPFFHRHVIRLTPHYRTHYWR